MMPSDIEMQVSELAAMDGRDGLYLLDVRSPEEYQYAAIAGAINIPMQDVPSRLMDLPRDRMIVAICHHGVRSLHVAQFLLAQGFTNVKSLAGGVDRWGLEIDQTLPKY